VEPAFDSADLDLGATHGSRDICLAESGTESDVSELSPEAEEDSRRPS
jgi:hypothetical protein